MQEVIISTKDLCKTYVSESVHFHAIRNLNLEIYKEDFTVIMGSSGSGKSTLLYLLSGIDSVTAGEVVLENTRPVSLLASQRITSALIGSIGMMEIPFTVNGLGDLSLLPSVPAGELCQRLDSLGSGAGPEPQKPYSGLILKELAAGPVPFPYPVSRETGFTSIP